MPRPVTFEFQPIQYQEALDRKEALRTVPRRAGVLRIFDVHDNLILLEKTHNLAKRIDRFYSEARESRALDLREITRRIEFCRTDSPLEALYLLYSERKRWYPDTYRRMRTFPRYYLLKINRRQRFPRLYAARQIKRGVEYFGPFTRRSQLDRFKATLERTFRIRPCQYNIRGNDPYPDCLYFQMGTCSKPCNGDIGRDAYLQDVDDAIAFTRGQDSEILSPMFERVRMLSEQTRFEEAEQVRRRLERVQRARKEHPQPCFDLWNFDFVVVMDTDSVLRRKIVLVRAGCIARFEEHEVENIEETLSASIHQSNPQEGDTIEDQSFERQYDEFCLISSFLVRPVRSVRLFPLGDPGETVAEIVKNLEEEKKRRTRPRSREVLEGRENKE